MTRLKLDLLVGESVSFDHGRIKVELLEKSGQRARLDISAGNDVQITTPKNIADFAKQGITIRKH